MTVWEEGEDTRNLTHRKLMACEFYPDNHWSPDKFLTTEWNFRPHTGIFCSHLNLFNQEYVLVHCWLGNCYRPEEIYEPV